MQISNHQYWTYGTSESLNCSVDCESDNSNVDDINWFVVDCTMLDVRVYANGVFCICGCECVICFIYTYNIVLRWFWNSARRGCAFSHICTTREVWNFICLSPSWRFGWRTMYNLLCDLWDGGWMIPKGRDIHVVNEKTDFDPLLSVSTRLGEYVYGPSVRRLILQLEAFDKLESFMKLVNTDLCVRHKCRMVGSRPDIRAAIISWLSSWKWRCASRCKRISHNCRAGSPNVLNLRSAATISASGGEWLTASCFLQTAVIDILVFGAEDTQGKPRQCSWSPSCQLRSLRRRRCENSICW